MESLIPAMQVLQKENSRPPQEIIDYRYNGDYKDFGGQAPTPIPGSAGSGIDGKAKARGAEQLKYQENVEKFGKENVANRQNPVGPNNKNRDKYMNAAGGNYDHK